MNVLVDDLTPEQLDEMYSRELSVVGIKGESLAARDRRFGRGPVSDDEQLDADLIDMQFGDLIAGDRIGRVQGDKAARAEFERRLREAQGGAQVEVPR